MNQIRHIFSLEFTMTKRHLGGILVLVGIGILCAAGLAEVINTETSEFGTVQKLATALGVVAVVLGTTLWPLGDHPA